MRRRKMHILDWVSAGSNAIVSLVLLSAFVGCTANNGRTANWKPAPGRPYEVRITGSNFQWHICYPGADGRLGTEDDIVERRFLHVPLGTKIILQLTSTDYLYSLTLPEFGIREIAVPELTFRVEIEATRTGTFDLLGDQMCGFTHLDLLGKMIVHREEEFAAWLNNRS